MALHFKIYLVVPGIYSCKMYYTSKFIIFPKVNRSIFFYLKLYWIISLIRDQVRLSRSFRLEDSLFVTLYGLPFHSFYWPMITKLVIFIILGIFILGMFNKIFWIFYSILYSLFWRTLNQSCKGTSKNKYDSHTIYNSVFRYWVKPNNFMWRWIQFLLKMPQIQHTATN